MSLPTEIRSVPARLVGEPLLDAPVSRRPRRVYRPLVVGPVLLRRDGPQGRWSVRVSGDGRLLPAPVGGMAVLTRRLQLCRAAGTAHRVGAALVAPQDMGPVAARLTARDEQPRSEFYGWSLMVQFPGLETLALVDPHERFADLPAFYESPLELIDRSTFLAGKGIVSRPIALFTQPADFVVEADGRLRNRFYPDARFRRPAGLDWLW
jgi:hypothetical protein